MINKLKKMLRLIKLKLIFKFMRKRAIVSKMLSLLFGSQLKSNRYWLRYGWKHLSNGLRVPNRHIMYSDCE